MAVLQRHAGPLLRPVLATRLSSRFILGLLLVLAAAFALLAVNQLSRTTKEGYAIDELQRQRALKQSENHALEADVARLTSLARIEIEARARLGLTSPTRVEHIMTDQPAPEMGGLLEEHTPAQGSDREEDEGDAPVWKRALKLLPFY